MLKNKPALVLATILIFSIAWICYKEANPEKTAFITIQDVYSNFDMKKEMEKKYTSVKNARDKILDSLNLELKILAGKIENSSKKDEAKMEDFNLKRDEFLQRKKSYEEDNDALSKKYDQEILSQLNQYVKDFGGKNGYTYIYGNDGNGSLMYANDERNITKEVVAFINDKYKGVE